MQPGLFYTLFKNDSIAADCGITSYFYIRLAQQFGYRCYQYSFGFTEKQYARFVHSFPVVVIDYKGGQRMIVQDPYLSLTFTGQRGEPLDFYLFLRLLKQKKYGEIKTDLSTVETRLLVPDTLQYWPFLSDSCKALLRERIMQRDGTVQKKIPFQRNYSNLMQSACDPFEQGFLQAMQAHGLYEPFLYAYTLRVNTMAGSADVEAVQNKVDSILHHTAVDD